MSAEVLERSTDTETTPGHTRRIAETIRNKRVIIFGFGPVGQALAKQLIAEGAIITAIVRSDGVYDGTGNIKVAELKKWGEFADVSAAFIALPTEGNGGKSLPYIHDMLGRMPVITAEKAALASNPELLKDKNMYATATVGGSTKMLKHINEYKRKKRIKKIEAVVNGTLNFLSSRMREGASLEEAIAEARKGQYLETDTDEISIILEDESRDVIRKAVIMANQSGMFDRVITEADVTFVAPQNSDLKGKRCIVRITEDGIEAGFIESAKSRWLSNGVNNKIRINGRSVKGAEGPGAGADITAATMIDDFKDALSD